MADQVESQDRLLSALVDRYALEKELGRGGMATVYLARDHKHDRSVAVKVLHPELAAVIGPDRFLREIKLTARLNHPNILPLLDSGEAEGFLFYVMPYVEGETLRHKLTRETQLAVEDALLYTQQVAAALHYAHGQGVMHRDIKPENILLHSGVAMVADFGIALALDAAGGDRLTETGLSIGTPEYMSPEQASGAKQLDARSDVYALGCVVHEMLAGDPPFTGQSPQAVIARQVLDPPPSIRTVRASVPAEIEGVVKRALSKSPADRWQTAEEFAAALKTPGPAGGSTKLSDQRGRRLLSRQRVIVGGIAIAALLLVGFLVRGSVRSTIIHSPTYTQLTFSGTVDRVEVSPDGDWLAYIEDGDPRRLFVQDLKGGETVQIAEVGPPSTLRWSPDGASILFTEFYTPEQYTVVTYPRLGSTPVPVQNIEPLGVWSPDGSQLASWWVATGGANSIRITTPRGTSVDSIHLPDSIGMLGEGDWNPNGRTILLKVIGPSSEMALWTAATDGSWWHRLVRDSTYVSAARWSGDGSAVYYFRGDPEQELRKINVTPDGRPQGGSETVPVGPFKARLGEDDRLSLTADGRGLVFIRAEDHSNLWLTQVTDPSRGRPNDPIQVTNGTGLKSRGRVSPDMQSVAYLESRGSAGDIVIASLNGGSTRRIATRGEAAWLGPHNAPAWSPNGTRLTFLGKLSGKNVVRTVDVDRLNIRTYEATDVGDGGLTWAPGEEILYSRAGNQNVYLLDPETEEEEPLVGDDSHGWIFQPVYSPDASQVVVQWNRTNAQPGLWLISLVDSTQTLLAPGGLDPIGWSDDGRYVYVHDWGPQIMAVPIAGGEVHQVATTPYQRSFPDAAMCSILSGSNDPVFVCMVRESVRDAWMIEDFDPAVR